MVLAEDGQSTHIQLQKTVPYMDHFYIRVEFKEITRSEGHLVA